MLKPQKHLVRFIRLIKNFNGRFPLGVSRQLVDAGWHIDRRWEHQNLTAFLNHFEKQFPPLAIKALTEFGGLDIGGTRGVICGYFAEHLLSSLHVIEDILDKPLFLIGWTNLFEDDGLSVLMDASGSVYVNGAIGDSQDGYRLDLIETDLDRALVRMLTPKPIPILRSWHYSFSQ